MTPSLFGSYKLLQRVAVGGISELVMRALAREKEDRYPDAREFQLALEGCLLACRWEVGTAGLSAMMQALFPTDAGAA